MLGNKFPVFLSFLLQFSSSIPAQNVSKETKKFGCCFDENDGMDNLFAELNSLKDKIFPVGYVFTQYGGQKSPEELFPQFQWVDITDTYSGQFFRVEGSESAPFDGVQEEKSGLKIKEFHMTNINSIPADNVAPAIQVAEGASKYLYVARAGLLQQWTSLTVVGEGYGTEIRPKNSAVRIWKRTL